MTYSMNLILSVYGFFPSIKPSFVIFRKFISFAETGLKFLIGFPSTAGFLFHEEMLNTIYTFTMIY